MKRGIERDAEDQADRAAIAEREALLGATAVEVLNSQHRAVIDAQRSAVQHAKSTGERLIKIREWIGEKEWPAWLRENAAFNSRTAGLYVKVARFLADPANAARVERSSLDEIEMIL